MKNKTFSQSKNQIVKQSPGVPPKNHKKPELRTDIKSIFLSHPKLGSLEIAADRILIAASDHHKIKALVIRGKESHWFERTCSLDELISTLDNPYFKRISKFYALNRQQCFSYNNKDNRIYFKNGHSARLDHPFKLSVYLAFMRL